MIKIIKGRENAFFFFNLEWDAKLIYYMAGWSGRKWSNLIGSLSGRNPAVQSGRNPAVQGYRTDFFLSRNCFLAIIINILLTELVRSG
jgi:hypothetical protein